MEYDTGDNPPTTKEGLRTAFEQLHRHGWKIVSRLTEKTGAKYALIIKNGNNVIGVVAKTSKIWKGTVSVHLELLKSLQARKIPLLMWVEPESEFTFFDPAEVLSEGEAVNVRFGEEMWNFEYVLGIDWKPRANIDSVIDALEARRREAERIMAARDRSINGV